MRHSYHPLLCRAAAQSSHATAACGKYQRQGVEGDKPAIYALQGLQDSKQAMLLTCWYCELSAMSMLKATAGPGRKLSFTTNTNWFAYDAVVGIVLPRSHMQLHRCG